MSHHINSVGGHQASNLPPGGLDSLHHQAPNFSGGHPPHQTSLVSGWDSHHHHQPNWDSHHHGPNGGINPVINRVTGERLFDHHHQPAVKAADLLDAEQLTVFTTTSGF